MLELKPMIHKFRMKDTYYCLDVNSGIIHVIDELIDRVLDTYDGTNREAVHAQLDATEDAAELKRLTLALYDRAKDYAATKDIILVDTKFEFGRDADGNITLGDEALTPDSSRFWDQQHNSFDKQYLRDYLATVWDKQSEPPTIPQEIVEKTAAKYEEALFKLTGKRS